MISIFVHYSVIQLRYFWWNYFLNNFSLLIGLLKLVCLLMMVGIHIHDDQSSWLFIMISQNVGIHFLMKFVFQQQFLYCSTWNSNQFLVLTFLPVNSISLCFDPWIFCHLLGVTINPIAQNDLAWRSNNLYLIMRIF